MIEQKDNLPSCFIGVISDTHGIMLQEIAEVFKSTDLIIHAGDIDRPDIIEALKTIAPVIAVRGNMDSGNWSRKLKKNETIEIANIKIYAIHDAGKIDIQPDQEGIQVVISGHTHCPEINREKGVLFLNPGSAGYPRKNTPHSVALLRVKNSSIDYEFVELEARF